MKKRLLSMLLVIAMAVCMLPTVFAAETSGTCGANLAWSYNSTTGQLTISGMGTMENFNYETNDAPWGALRGDILTIVVEDGVTSIGDGAFAGCASAQTVALPDSVTSIGQRAFEACGAEELTIPENMTTIGAYAFFGASITAITISEGVTEIQDNAFNSCYNLEEVHFPSTLESVGEGAFEQTSIDRVYIPDMESWCNIQFDSFFATPFAEYGGTDLYVDDVKTTDIVIPDGVTTIGVSQFQTFNNMTSITIPNTVTRVEESAFDMLPQGAGARSKLRSITFPDSVTYIGDDALCCQENLEEIYILNPDCEIATERIEIIDGESYYYMGMYYHERGITSPVIYGYAGSTAQTYAETSGLEFVALEEVCQHTSTTVINAKAATCTETGLTEGVKCSVCGTVITAQTTVPAKGHSYGDWVQVTAPTIDAKGSEQRTCATCGGKESRDVAKLENVFGDVSDNDYYATPVAWAASEGITTGKTESSFAPNDDCTRAQIVTFIWRSQGEPEPKTTDNPFTDVKESDYYYKAVLWAVENSITTGTSTTTFNPDGNCTRAQAVTFLWRADGKPTPSNKTSHFTDLKAGAYYIDAVTWAVENGITTGTSTTAFSPEGTCIRGQIVTFLWRYMNG